MKPSSLLIFITVVLLESSNANYDWDIFDIFPWKLDPDFNRNLTELITSKGYPVQEYTAQTPDGYLLTVLNIPSGRKKVYGVRQEKKVVFLQHGLLSSACDWVLNFPNQSLAFILADHGYDVWLGNIRGNTYARKNIYYPPESSKFWNFSFDEMAEYDIPSMIDLILNVTGKKNLTYIGHSQGTTVAFALLSQKAEYNEKINMFIALAPVTTVGHITSAIRYLAPFTPDVDFLFSILGVDEFLPNNIVMKYLSEILCDTKIKFICEDVIFLICGTDYSQLNATRLGVYVSHTPAGASTKSIIHYAQMVNSKKFQMYDYGSRGNMLHYNQTSAPVYHLENITTKVGLIWSENDKLADPTDIHILEKKLKNVILSTPVKLKEFNHLDFVWGIDANILVYDNVLSLLKKNL
ncbi:gastric triacylglycerol lipase-like [Argiope bruennichi]|uniref:gastric triacylglycerol lipase-like n=1 Tax=Argiope bruennichi TaxID=94029 RepID=UPI0024958B59|nr:gastric triacylglycerol lipase-like [Argiope bruennichi]